MNYVGLCQQETVIVCFGNSTTAVRKGVKKVYAERLHEKLESIHIKNLVINSGIGSSHTGSINDNSFAKVVHGRDRFDTAVIRYHPNWVTINFGLNDAYQDKGIGTSSRIPINKFKKNIKYFIKHIKKQGSQIILLTPNPQTSTYDEFRRQQVKIYAKSVKKIARQKKTFFIDTWQLFYNWGKNKSDGIDSLFLDKVHPNDKGHELIAEEIFKIIKLHTVQ
ncbi:MAG: SGNH/GDSL hydrolase family protein [Niabella sp.]